MYLNGGFCLLSVAAGVLLLLMCFIGFLSFFLSAHAVFSIITILALYMYNVFTIDNNFEIHVHTSTVGPRYKTSCYDQILIRPGNSSLGLKTELA